MKHNIILLSLLLVSNSVIGDTKLSTFWYQNSNSLVGKIENSLYKNKCGNCHFPYAPGLLPPQSWEKIMINTNDHFSKKILLDSHDKNDILNYLLDNAAGRSKYILTRQFAKVGKTLHIRITQSPFFIEKHPKTEQKISQCDTCHTDALNGSFAPVELKKD